jgi:predicted SprT family Zn-dependent metalloprotease
VENFRFEGEETMDKGKVKELDIVGEIRNAFKCLNDKIFNNKIIFPSIKVDANKNFMFRFSGKPNQHYEIIIGRRIGSFDKNVVLSNIVHEMIHALNYSENVKGITSNRYHNKKFLTEALNAGLYVAREKSTGWSATSYKHLKDDDSVCPKEDDNAALIEVFDSFEFSKNVLAEAKKDVERIVSKTKGRQYFLKYMCNCPEPHNSIRSGRRSLDVVCGECGCKFVVSNS